MCDRGLGKMNNMKKFIISLSVAVCLSSAAFSAPVHINDLRSKFLNNSAIIYEINIRTFNAQDTNGNGIIDFDEGEESGNFLNAIANLDELQAKGVNAIHILPVTPVGKMKALGTAGSLYAASGFNSLNPQLKSENTMLTLEEQARKFIQEAHDRGIAVIVDVPACGSYDLFMQRPELFVKDKSGQAVIPADWTDVRLLNAGTEAQVNKDVLNLYKEFVDYMMDLGVDGIRADVAHCKPAKFWKELIDYSRKKDPQLLWLAESSNSWKDAVSEYAVFTSYDKLLQAGFDGYYGSYFNMKDWKSSKDLFNQVNLDRSLSKKIGQPKSVIGSFTTHDELSPVLINGKKYSEMIMWLNSTLPLNAYYVDGFDTGDNYIYFWANKKAPKTFTDDDYYFAHRGKIDIFNFSRRPGGKDKELSDDFKLANQFKKYAATLNAKGHFIQLRTNNPSVFAYAVSDTKESFIVIGNMNFTSDSEAVVRIPGFKGNEDVIVIKTISTPVSSKGKMTVRLEPGEIQVLVLNSFPIK